MLSGKKKKRQKKQEMSHVGLSDRYKEFNHSNVQAGGGKTGIHLSSYGFHNTLPAVNKGVSSAA